MRGASDDLDSIMGKIGKQPLKRAKGEKVVVYHQGVLYEATLKFSDNGSFFYIETMERVEEEI